MSGIDTNSLYYSLMQPHIHVPELLNHISGATYCVTGFIAVVAMILIWRSPDSPDVSVGYP